MIEIKDLNIEMIKIYGLIIIEPPITILKALEGNFLSIIFSLLGHRAEISTAPNFFSALMRDWISV